MFEPIEIDYGRGFTLEIANTFQGVVSISVLSPAGGVREQIWLESNDIPKIIRALQTKSDVEIGATAGII